VVEQNKLTKGKAALVMGVSALAALVSATKLHGWHLYVGLGAIGAAIFAGFVRWNRKYSDSSGSVPRLWS
jgi:predicted dinucleotide-utilizing enzyme